MTAPAPNAADLVDLNTVKRWLDKQGDTGTADDLLAPLITALSAEIGTFLQRNLLLKNYTETFNGNGHSTYVTRNFPLVAVTGVTTQGNTVTPRPGLSTGGVSVGPIVSGVSPAGYTYDDIAVYLDGYSFVRGNQNCTVNYTAGYLSKALSAWVSGTYAVGTLIQDGNGNTEIAVASTGATGGMAPVWPTTIGSTVVDGGVTWMLCLLGQPGFLPYDLVQAVVEALGHVYKSRDRIGLAELSAGAQGGSTRFLADFPAHTIRVLNRYRRSTGF